MMYNYLQIQVGTSILNADGTRSPTLEHRCSSIAIWPHKTKPTKHNLIMTDPCLTLEGLEPSMPKLEKMGIPVTSPWLSKTDPVGSIFVTHLHDDHFPKFSEDDSVLFDHFITKENIHQFPDVHIESIPGHSPDSKALAFISSQNQIVWIVGDAILSETWLINWKYFWPNNYSPQEVKQTWSSVGKILSEADVIIPGHGEKITVNEDLLKIVIKKFPKAEQFENCSDVLLQLQKKLESLQQ